MYAGTPGTLEWIKHRAVFQRKDFSSVPMSNIAKIAAQYDKEHSNIDEQAALFYLSSHIFHLIESASGGPSCQLSKAHADFVTEHVKRLNELSIRMFSYLCIVSAEEACFGEARNDGLWDFVESSTSADASKWLSQLFNRKTHGGYLSGTGSATAGECLKAVEMGFRFGRWSPGFGGLPWAQITQAASEVVYGSSSMELCIDKAFTLCHNNGAIFNKGHVFGHYSGSFYTLLDIQASGQVPAAISSGHPIEALKHPSVKKLHALGKTLFPQEFSVLYDPSKVKSMEALRKAKEAAAHKKAVAFIASGGGGGSGGAFNQPAQPPKRACDNLLTLDELESIHKNVSGGLFK